VMTGIDEFADDCGTDEPGCASDEYAQGRALLR
jgi:hypothetical protein